MSTTDTILRLSNSLARNWDDNGARGDWEKEVANASTDDLIVVAGRLSANLLEPNEWGPTHPRFKALREAVLSEIERKNATQVTVAVGDFKASADKLAGKTYWATVFVIILTIVLILQTGVLIYLDLHPHS